MKLMLLIAGVTLACGCGSTTADNAKSASEYEALQLSCVDHASTKAMADECRCAVKKTWGRAGPECGAKDGGAE